jgi:uncharacterized protein
MRPDRIQELDLLRGVAVCGLLLVNITLLGWTAGVVRPPPPAAFNLDWSMFGVQQLFIEGSMRGLFTLLFGAGVVLVLRRSEARSGSSRAVQAHLRRCFGLLLLGLFCVLLMWPYEILAAYGIAGLVLLPFRNRRPRILLIWSAIIITVYSAGFALIEYRQGPAVESVTSTARSPAKVVSEQGSQEVSSARTAASNPLHKSRERAAEAEQRSHWLGALRWSTELWMKRNLSPSGAYAIIESVAFMLVGMALLSLGVLSGQQPIERYLQLAAAGYAVGLTLRGAWLYLEWRNGFAGSMAADVYKGATYETARLAITLGHLGFIIWIYQRGLLGRARPLVSVGRMALTNYIAHAAVGALLFTGLGLLDRLSYPWLLALAVCISCLGVLGSQLWLNHYALGPAEWLLRRMAHSAGSGNGARASRPR